MRGAATLLALRTEPGRLPRHPIPKRFFQKRLGGPVSNRGYANLPAMTRGALFEKFACKPAIRAKVFVVARAWRSYPGRPDVAQFPDVFRVTRYDNKK
jgi:hypothetical protein